MKVSKAAPAIMAFCGAALFTAPADAQPAAQPPAHDLSLGREERVALQALEAVIRSPDRAAQDAALAAARGAAQSAGARHALAHYQLEIARARQDRQMYGQAIDQLLSGGLATAEEMPTLLMDQASRAYYDGEFQQAERLLARVTELQPNNAAILAESAQIRSLIGMALVRGGRQAEAQSAFQQSVTMLARAIEMQRAGGQLAPESWFKRGLAVAADRSLGPQSVAFARALVTSYPSPLNWRDALLVYHQVAQADPALDLDIKRLMRATQALSGERDYLEAAEALGRAGLAGEVKALVAEGISRGMLSASEPRVRQLTTANDRLAATERSGLARARTQALAAATGAPALAAGDEHFGNGQYAEAAELYRAALQKGGTDPNLVNSRLGAALALGGQRVEAEAAFRAVTGPRAELAAFWLAWLARRTA